MTNTAKWKAALSIAVLTTLIGSPACSQTPGDHAAEITQSEYELFSAYIAHFFVGKAGKDRIGLPVSQIIIVDTSEYDESEVVEDMTWNDVEKLLRKEVRSLELATLNNFREVNRGQQVVLQQRFDLPVPYKLAAHRTIRSILHNVTDWPEYYKRYPGAQGFLTFSRIGFSPDGKQAIFYATNHCGGLCATGSFTVAKKYGRKWMIVKEVILWVS